MANDISMLFEHEIFSKQKTKITLEQLSEMNNENISVFIAKFNPYDQKFQLFLHKIKTPPRNKRQNYILDNNKASKKTCLELINNNILYLGNKVNDLSEIPFLRDKGNKVNNYFSLLSIDNYKSIITSNKLKCF
jgi:hypothetical protein